MKKLPHGTECVLDGRLRGATDVTDYFYFFCPKCPDDRLLRILDYQLIHEEPGNKYNNICKRMAHRSFIIGFDIACEQCGLRERVKISNMGWQDGTHSAALRRITDPA